MSNYENEVYDGEVDDGGATVKGLLAWNSQREDGRKLWERLPKETDRAFHAFGIYRMLPPETRTVAEVARLMNFTSPAQCYLWSRKYHWRERVAAYDNHMSRMPIFAEAASLEAYQRRVVSNTTQVLGALFSTLEQLTAQTMKAAAEGTLSPKELSQLVKAAADIDTLARRTAGLPITVTSAPASKNVVEDDVYFITPNGSQRSGMNGSSSTETETPENDDPDDEDPEA